MAKQDGGKSHEAQLESLLPLPLGPGTHYRGLQESVGSFGLAGPRGEIQAALASFKWLGGPDEFSTSEGCFLKTPFGNDQRHFCHPGEDQFLSLQSNVCGSAVHRG